MGMIFLLVMTLLFSGCHFGSSKTTITSIEVDSSTLEASYDVETFDITSIKIKVNYSDGTNKQLNVQASMLSSEHLVLLSSAGEHEIIVNYEGKTTTLNIKLISFVQPTITSIEVDSSTSKEAYDIDTFDITSIKIKVNYSNGTNKQLNVQSSMLSSEHLALLSSAGEHAIIISYEGKTTTLNIKLFKKEIQKFTVTFDSMGGSKVSPMENVNDGETIELPVPTKVGYTFEGWWTGKEADDAQFTNASRVTKDIVLYARWEVKELTIKFVVRSGLVSTALIDLLNEFKTLYPHITVHVEALSGSDDLIRSTIMMDINTNCAPDLVIGYPDHFAEYYSAGALVNLSTYINDEVYGYNEAEIADFIESYLDENRGFDLTKPQDLYGLPFNKATEVLVYNKTFFESLYGDTWETKIPKTWPELETIGADIMTRVRNGEADNIFVQSINPQTQTKTYLKLSNYLNEGKFIPLGYDSADNAFITLTRQFGAAYTERINVERGYVRFHNQRAKDAMAYFKGLRDDGVFGTPALYGLNSMFDAFKLIQSVMTICSSAGVGYNAASQYAYELGVAPIPYYSADKKDVIQQGTNIAMLNQNTEDEKLAAWLLIKFLMEPKNSAQLAMATGGYFPGRKSAYETTEYLEYLTNPSDNKVHYSKAANVVLNDYIKQNYEFIYEEALVGSSLIKKEVGSIFKDIIVGNADIEASFVRGYNNLPQFKPSEKPGEDINSSLFLDDKRRFLNLISNYHSNMV